MTTFANFDDKKYRVLSQMKRVLKDDGKIIISVFSEDALKERLKVYKKVGAKIKSMNEKTGKIVFADAENNVSEQFSKKELRQIFKKARLNIIEIKKLNIAYISKLRK